MSVFTSLHKPVSAQSPIRITHSIEKAFHTGRVYDGTSTARHKDESCTVIPDTKSRFEPQSYPRMFVQ
jgi:hypothetical protein